MIIFFKNNEYQNNETLLSLIKIISKNSFKNILIAGPTASGRSTLSDFICEKSQPKFVSLLNYDKKFDEFRDITHANLFKQYTNLIGTIHAANIDNTVERIKDLSNVTNLRELNLDMIICLNSRHFKERIMEIQFIR